MQKKHRIYFDFNNPLQIFLSLYILSNANFGAVGAPYQRDNKYVDFCHGLKQRHWRLTLSNEYDYIHNSNTGVCKVCDTISPNFLARTDVFTHVGPFNPDMSGHWILLGTKNDSHHCLLHHSNKMLFVLEYVT